MPTSSSSAFAPTAPARIERYETIVVGAGQAGLAVGHYLAKSGQDFTIVTGEQRVGDNWRNRWDSLKLFTPARFNGMPGMAFPAAPQHLADKDEVADYLERYAQRFDLPVQLNARADALRWNGTRYEMTVGDVTLEADNVVVATGASKPNVPALSAELSPDIHQLHSSAYQNPFMLPNGPALVVGAGNSGVQIAIELAKHRKVWLSGRDTGYLPRRILGRDLFDWFWPVMSRAHLDTSYGRFLRERARRGGDSRIGIPERAVRDAGVVRVGRLEAVRGGLPVCGDETLMPSSIVWSTGFDNDLRWIQLPALANGLRHKRGVVADAPGLYFVGLRFQHRMSSSLLGGVGADAEWIAAQVAARTEKLVAA